MVNFLNNQAKIDFQFNKCGKYVSGTAQTATVTTVVKSPKLTVQKIVCGTCYEPGHPITYSIAITNAGDTAATNIAVWEPLQKQDYLPNSAALTINGQPTPPCALKVGYIICESGISNKFGFKFGNLAPGSTAVITFQTMPFNDACEIYNQVVVFFGTNSTCSGRESVVSNRTAVKKSFARINAEKKVNKTTAACGDDLVYTITLSNCGNLKAQNVKITDQLPQGFTLKQGGVCVNGFKHKYTLSQSNLLTICGFTIPAKTCQQNSNGSNKVVITIHGKINCGNNSTCGNNGTCGNNSTCGNNNNIRNCVADFLKNSLFSCEECIESSLQNFPANTNFQEYGETYDYECGEEYNQQYNQQCGNNQNYNDNGGCNSGCNGCQ